MSKSNLFVPTLIISYLTVFSGALLKILHLDGGTLLLGIALLMTVTYVIIALSEIHNSDRYRPLQKLRWTIGFILFSSIAGILYLVQRREKEVRS